MLLVRLNVLHQHSIDELRNTALQLVGGSWSSSAVKTRAIFFKSQTKFLCLELTRVRLDGELDQNLYICWQMFYVNV